MAEPASPPPDGRADERRDLPGTGRTEAFSDGVFAIVITLLVLDVANPHYHPGGLGAALAGQWPAYLAFGLSFVYVGVIYAIAAALMSAAWLATFSYLARHPDLLQSGTTTQYVRQQLSRPLTGIGLYAISALAGWLISPIAGLICIIAMMIYHALTSEGLHDGPLGRLTRRTRS